MTPPLEEQMAAARQERAAQTEWIDRISAQARLLVYLGIFLAGAAAAQLAICWFDQ